MTPNTSKATASAPALENGLTLLERLARAETPLGFNELIQQLTVSKASAVRLLKILRRRGYVSKEALSGKYTLGHQATALSRRSPSIEFLRGESVPVLSSLVASTGNTALVIYWNGHQMLCLEKQVHQLSIAMQEVGTISADLGRYPWGWIIYSQLTPEEQVSARSGMQDRELFELHYPEWIERYHRSGYALDDQTVMKTIRRYGAPLFDDHGMLVGALGLGGNSLTIPDDKLESTGQAVVAHAARLSAAT